jgi:hypothetical protein
MNALLANQSETLPCEPCCSIGSCSRVTSGSEDDAELAALFIVKSPFCERHTYAKAAPSISAKVSMKCTPTAAIEAPSASLCFQMGTHLGGCALVEVEALLTANERRLFSRFIFSHPGKLFLLQGAGKSTTVFR